jgi:hypothetical protein
MTAATSDKSEPHSRSRWPRELSIFGAALGFGLLIMPLAVYGVGLSLLGAYSGGPHIGSFLGDYFRNLGSGALRTWFLVASPYLAVLILRAIFRRWRQPKSPEDFREPPAIADVPIPSAAKSSPPSRAASSGKVPRREPFVSP